MTATTVNGVVQSNVTVHIGITGVPITLLGRGGLGDHRERGAVVSMFHLMTTAPGYRRTGSQDEVGITNTNTSTLSVTIAWTN